jgi:acyl-ACP thioesterase
MNNSKYVQVAEEYLPADARVGGIRVEYKKAAVLGDTLCPTIIETEGQSFVELKNEAGKPYATIQFRIGTGS